MKYLHKYQTTTQRIKRYKNVLNLIAILAVSFTGFGQDALLENEEETITENTPSFFVPNVFTPNGDQRNDSFGPIFKSENHPSNYTMTIYNRWGQKIFESHNPIDLWDGSLIGAPVPEGIYIWKMTLQSSEIGIDSKNQCDYHGYIHLFR